MAHTVFRSRRAHRLAFAALSASAACLPGVAWAQCTPSGSTINCTGSVTSYSNTGASGVTVNVAATASITAPMVIGTASGAGTLATQNYLNNLGTITGTTAISTVQMGDWATVYNGTSSATTAIITSSGSTTGAAAITLGNNGTVINYGTLTAVAGTPAVQFGAGGTFINEALAPAAISGNIVFGASTGSANSTFTNYNTTYGVTGNVTSVGNTTVNNQGLWTGSFTQTTVGSGPVVTINNGTVNGTNANVVFTGVISTQDTTTLTNNTNATMYLYPGTGNSSGLGTAVAGTSQLINDGTLTIGTGTTTAQQVVNGNFVQSATGTLNMMILTPGALGVAAGTNYSQIYAQNGTANLNGALALNITPGFYPSGSVYQVISADNGITGQFSTITGANLPFITFVPVGCVFGTNCTQGSTEITTTTVTTNGVTTTTVTTTPNAPLGTTTTTSGTTTTTTTTVATGVITPTGTVGIVSTGSGAQEAYEFVPTRTAANAYATALAAGLAAQGTSTTSVVSVNEVNIARGLQPLVASANAAYNTSSNSTDDVIAFVGQIDVLTIPQAQAFLDSVSPEGYLAYKRALHDQANAFERSIDLRMTDQNSKHPEDGWWFNTQGEYETLSSAPQTQGYRTRDNLLGFVGGYDFSGPHHVLGVAMNLSWDALSYAPGTMTGHNRDIALAAYGAYNVGPLHFTGQVAYNLGHLGANKTINLDTVTRAAHAGASEGLLKATGTVGVQFVAVGYTFEPFVGVDIANGSVHGFTETNALSADLTVASINANRNDLLAGASLSRASGTFRPYMRAVYRSQFGTGGPDSVSAYFNGDSTTTFTVTGVPEGRHELDANTGVNWVFDDAGSLFVGYQGTFRAGHHSSGLNFGVRLEF